MTQIYNSEFEICLRILVLLSETKEPLSKERIGIVDLISLYGKEFNVSSQNLNGDNSLFAIELNYRLQKITKAIKWLVVKGLIKVHNSSEGFMYLITNEGINFCSCFDSDYANEYSIETKKSLMFVQNKSDDELRHLLNKMIIRRNKNEKI